MSSFTRALAAILALGLAGGAAAQTAATSDAPAEQPAVTTEAAAAAAAPAAAASAEAAPAAQEKPATKARPAPAPHTVVLGPAGYDAAGKPGRVHTVATGDTLWDISDAYLGTPWVWPSIWKDNTSVANPHLIYPGDHIWVAPGEMRRVSQAEADALLNGTPASGDPASAMDGAAYDALPADADLPKTPTFRYSARDGVGLISEEMLKGAASIVDNADNDRKWLGSMDRIHVGLGAGEVETGEQLVVFRARERVYDPDSRRPLGWHVRVLGWVEVQKVEDQVAQAEVRMAFAEMKPGDRLLPRELMPLEVELRPTAPGIDGQIAFLASDRVASGTDDVVFLDLGMEDGLEVGNTLDVYRPQGEKREFVKDKDVAVPPRIVGRIVVVSAFPHSAAGVVERASTEIEVGDRVRSHEAPAAE